MNKFKLPFIFIMCTCIVSCNYKYIHSLKEWTSPGCVGEVDYIILPIRCNDSTYLCCTSTTELYLDLDIKIIDEEQLGKRIYHHIRNNIPLELSKEYFEKMKGRIVRPNEYIDSIYRIGGSQALKDIISNKENVSATSLQWEDELRAIYLLWNDGIFTGVEFEEEVYVFFSE